MAQRILKFREDDVIIQEGQSYSEMYKILSGSVTIYFNYRQEKEYMVGILTPGRCFGEYGMLTKQPEYYTVVANEDTGVMAIEESEFDNFLRNNHGNVLDIIRNMAQMISVMKINFSMIMDEMEELIAKDTMTKENFNRLMSTAKKLYNDKYVIDFKELDSNNL